MDYQDKYPLCPHCGKEISTAKELRLGADKLFFTCPKCRKVLGVQSVGV